MKELRPVEIVGGGLAGLSLGLALRREGVPATIFEAGSYPRHRVCGEFITGLRERTIARLGLSPLLTGARQHRQVTWFARGKVRRQMLPQPALALSRHLLDTRLAEAFVDAGGRLLLHTRVDPAETPSGRVFAHGRRRGPGGWLGLKIHARHFELHGDLEVHLGDQAYVGVSGIEDGRVNLCGLFRQRPGVGGIRESVLPAYLAAAGLHSLAHRLAHAEVCAESLSAVAGLSFARSVSRGDRIEIGDALAMIPPFTGNGMAMAFEGAAAACDPLVAWAAHRATWPETICTVRRRLARAFRLRLVAAAVLHPFLLSRTRQRWLTTASLAGSLPLRPLYHVLH